MTSTTQDLVPLPVKINNARLIAGVSALLGVAFSVFLFFTTHGMTTVVFGMGFCCALGALYALIGLGNAACPSCEYVHSNVGLKQNESLQCKGCGEYFYIKDGMSLMTDDSAVEEFPAFGTPCPREIVWPEGCCVCQEAATKEVSVYLEIEENAPLAQDLLTRAATLGTFRLVSKSKFAVQVPVCADHGPESAELEFRDEEAQLYIRFRSRKYANAFKEANGPVFWDS